MPCIESSPAGHICKYHSGLIYNDDFTQPLAGRWTIEHDHDKALPEVVDPDDQWNIRPDEGYGFGAPTLWHLDGYNVLRVRHDQAETGVNHYIVNDEVPNLYVLDAAGRDYPWFTYRMDAAGVADPDQFAYDLAYSGIVHRIHDNNEKFLLGLHHHRCGIFSTWVFIYMYADYSMYPNPLAQSQLVNLTDNWWFIKHHIDEDEYIFDQGKPAGWSVGTDQMQLPAPGSPPLPYLGQNGKMGFMTQTCGSWTVDGYVRFHGLRIVETNYIEIRGIPPNPDGTGNEPSWVPGHPLPAGKWRFRWDHPNIGTTNNSDTYTPNDESEITISFDFNISTVKTVQWLFQPDAGIESTIDEFDPTIGVNGGDVYWLGPDEPPPWPPGSEVPGVGIQGGCADYEQIWLHAPVLNDIETGFIPGDTHQYARQIKGFGTLTIVGDVAFEVVRYRGEDPVLIAKTASPFDNGDGSYDISIMLTQANTRLIGYQDAFHFQLRFTLSDGSVVTPNAGLIKGVPFEVIP
jgi:hypothetical protein